MIYTSNMCMTVQNIKWTFYCKHQFTCFTIVTEIGFLVNAVELEDTKNGQSADETNSSSHKMHGRIYSESDSDGSSSNVACTGMATSPLKGVGSCFYKALCSGCCHKVPKAIAKATV